MNRRLPRPASVMLVDDSAAVRERLAAQVAELPGARVVAQAATAMQGIILFGDLRPDVVVMDILINGSSGIGLLRRIKLHAPRCIIIVLTNAFASEVKEACRRAGADHFLHKATEFERVNTILDDLARLGPPCSAETRPMLPPPSLL